MGFSTSVNARGTGIAVLQGSRSCRLAAREEPMCARPEEEFRRLTAISTSRPGSSVLAGRPGAMRRPIPTEWRASEGNRSAASSAIDSSWRRRGRPALDTRLGASARGMGRRIGGSRSARHWQLDAATLDRRRAKLSGSGGELEPEAPLVGIPCARVSFAHLLANGFRIATSRDTHAGRSRARLYSGQEAPARYRLECPRKLLLVTAQEQPGSPDAGAAWPRRGAVDDLGPRS